MDIKMDNLLLKTIVMDTETTSPNYNEAEVIELGFVLKVEDEWEQFDELHKPSEPITPEISAVTNITNRMVEDKISFKDAMEDLDKIMDALGTPDDSIIVAHNVRYDKGVFDAGYPESSVCNYPWVCTLRMARKLFLDDETVTQYNLPYLRYRFDLDLPDDLAWHRASVDALVTAKLFEFLLDEAEKQGIFEGYDDKRQRLIDWQAEPIIYTKMQFGKHKDEEMKDVPTSYWAWALKNMDSLDEDSPNYDPDFAASVCVALEDI